jgi:phosphoglucosamine mutase
MRKIFGTDGVRGRINQKPMDPTSLLHLALATAQQFHRGNHRHRAIIGKDTRLSGYMVENALSAGLLAMGMDVLLVGPLPTPAIAMLTRSMRADLGVMISASHNPFFDNGIKLFGPDGYKLSDALEVEIEQRMRDIANGAMGEGAQPGSMGRAKRIDDAAGRYIEAVKSTFGGGRLDGIRVVVDCAHGAAYKVAPTVLTELGAEVVTIGTTPNGININEGCGALEPAALAASVLEHGAQLGIALDGDADRVQLIDEKGALIDGDQILGVIARHWAGQGRLAAPGIVATVMSNLGLERFMQDAGIPFHRTPVGDRYVVEAMRRLGACLGGEQSGHIILGEYATTGDGLMAALQGLAILLESQAPASRALRAFTPLPQKIRNVRYSEESPLETERVREAIASAEAKLGGRGRLIVRKSGTEPLIRLMAESDDPHLLDAVLEGLAATIAA